MHGRKSLQLLSPAPPEEVAKESVFVKYSLDGKEASLVTVSFDDSNNLLWITSKSSLQGISLDLFQLKV